MIGSIDIRQLVAIGLRWWWLIILLPAVTAATAYMFTPQPKPVFEAVTTLRVGSQSNSQSVQQDFDFTTSEKLARTYLNMAGRYAVLQGAIDTLGLEITWRDLKDLMEAQIIPGTELIEIRVTTNSPDKAQMIADAVANQLIILSQQQNQKSGEEAQFVRQRLQDLQAKIEAGQERLETLGTRLDSPLSVEQTKTIQNEISTLENLMTTWESNYGQLLGYLGGEKAAELTIIEPAQANRKSANIQPYHYPLAGAGAGLALAIGLIYLLEILDDTFKSADDLSETLGVMALGAVVKIDGKEYQDKLITVKDLFSPGSESFRKIRSSMQFLSIDRPVKSIIITSSGPGEGKSITAANLGVVMAQAGLKTIIVDADLRRPVQHQIFRVPNSEGLTNFLLAPEGKITDYLGNTSIENLLVMTSGGLPPNPSELLGSQKMGHIISDLNEIADIVIYDSPPVLPVVDAAVLSNRLDGVVLVVHAGKTRREIVKQAVSTLQQANAHLLGTVLNRVSAKKRGYQAYYHSYYAPQSRAAVKQPPQAKPERRPWLSFLK